MKNLYLIKSTSGYHYLVDVKNRIVQLIHPEFEKELNTNSSVLSSRKRYYAKKKEYFERYGLFQNRELNYDLKVIDSEFVEANFVNTPQIVFEVTDQCNLKCKYCGYGELYNNYDKRNTRKADFERSVRFLDYYFSICEKRKVINENLSFGFYGGEPLLNFSFVKDFISYLENKYSVDKPYVYYITTNGVYLDSYMDYLVDKKFYILISLDGDEYASSYRVNSKSENVFEKVVKNIDILRKKYPKFYEENVDFSAVLHDRNSIEEVILFFKEKFKKTPKIGSLNPTGVNPLKKNEYLKMYNNNFNFEGEFSYNEKEKLPLLTPSALKHARFLNDSIFSSYQTYLDLLIESIQNEIIPTATCFPFGKKIFITVNGKILPCERIGHRLSLGRITEDSVDIDFCHIADLYNDLYKHVYDKQCSSCSFIQNCISCLFHTELNRCSKYGDYNNFRDYLKSEIDFFEKHRLEYKYLKNIVFK